MSARDIQELLNDDTIEISKRIQLAESFANTKRDNFPEKCQIVIDWICNFIAIRKEDVNIVEIWHLLHTVLQQKTGEIIKFSNSFFDAICVGLVEIVNGNEDEISFYVISICEEALKNNRFISTLNFKTSVYIHLLSVTMQTVAEMKLRGLPHLDQAMNVLTQLFKLAREICGKELDQEWVFDTACEKLLNPAAVFTAAFLDDAYQESELSISFKKMIEDLFFNFSHVPSYETMIKHLFGELKMMNRNMSKFIACVRQSCLQRIGVSETATESRNACCLLVVLYQSFLDRYHSRFPTLEKVRFLMIMLKMNGIEAFIGENPMITSDLSLSVENSESEKLKIMQKLVRTLSSKQNDLSVAVGSDEVMLKLYKSLRKSLLSSFSTRPVSWFESLDSLLDVNVAILRPALKPLLIASWLGVSQISSDEENAQIKFICHLVSIYIKLFQLPSFIEVMLVAYPDAKSAKQKLPVEVMHVFRKGFEELPCGQILKIWKVLVSSINDTLSGEPIEKGNTCLHMAVSLLHSLIRHMRLLELTMTPTDVQLFEELLDISFSQCMPKLLDLSLVTQDSHIIFSYLLLSQAFGDFVILLGNYSPNYSTKISSQLANFKTKRHHWDLECLHFYTKSDKWKKMFELIQSAEEPKLSYLATSLVLQKVEACICFGDDECAKQAADKAVKFFTVFPSFGKHRVAPWNYEADDVNEENIHAAVWTNIALHLKQLISYCSESGLKTITNMIVDIIAMQKKNQNKKKKLCCPFMEAETLMSWDEITELSSLQTALVTCVVQSCRNMFANKSFKGEQMLEILCSKPNTWLEFANTIPKLDETPNEIWESVQAASAVLLETMKCEVGKDVSTLDKQLDWTKFSSLLRVLELLPLRHLLPGNNIRTVFFIICTMCYLPTLEDLKMRIELEVRCKKMFLSILDSQRQQFLFKFMRSSDIIDWMLQTFENCFMVDDHLLDGHLIEEYHDLSALLVGNSVKLIVRSNAYFKDLDDCITKFSEEKSYTATRLHLTFTVAVLDGVKHARKRFDHAPQKMQLFKTYFHALQGVLLVYARKLVDKTLSQWTHHQNMKMKHVLFRGFAIILDHKCMAEPESVITLGNYLRAILQEALDVIKSGNFDDSSCDLIHISIANYDELEEFVPEKFVRGVWQSINAAKRVASEGKLEIMEDNEAKERSLNGLLEVICTYCSPEEFQKHILNELIDSIGGSNFSDENLEKIDVSVRIWLIILKMELDEEKWIYMRNTVSEVFSLTGDLLTFVFQNNLTPLNQSVAVNLLKLNVAMLSSFQNDLSMHELDLCLHSCMCCHLNNLEDLKTFSLFFTIIYEVCNSILKNHLRSAQLIVPSFVSFIQYILSEMMKRSHQEKLQHSSEDTDIMHKCALNMERLFTLMSTSKSFVNSAAHVIGKYVNDLPKATLLPIIKTTLTIGMQRLLAICNREGLVLLRCNLKSGSKELFAQLYDDFINNPCSNKIEVSRSALFTLLETFGTIQKDLKSSNSVEVCLGLSAFPRVIGPHSAPALVLMYWTGLLTVMTS